MIVSHTVTTSPQSSTRMNAVYVFTDHVGGTKTIRRLVSNALDTNADALSLYSAIENRLSILEINKAISMLEEGKDITSLAITPIYNTSKNLVKAVFRHIMKVKDPYLVLAMEPLIIYIRANYTNAQIINLLDFTAEQASKMNTRINAILDNAAAFTTYNTNAEDIE